MDKTVIIGVMGGARVSRQTEEKAYRLGTLIADQGWVLLNGGRRAGVMDASARGAATHGGMTIGILPGDDRSDASPYIRIGICTGMGSARNTINVLSCDVVVACPGGSGTLSEIALALKHDRPVIVMGEPVGDFTFGYLQGHRLVHVRTPEDAVAQIRQLLIERRQDD